MTVITRKCPRCAGVRPARHCNSPTCDLIWCADCEGYGATDGRRWQKKVAR